MIIRILLSTTLVFLPASATAQSLAGDVRVQNAVNLLERWLDTQQAYRDIPGISAAVVHDQELLWSGGFGHAERATNLNATPTTIYSICSISKLFTSVALMQLRDKGMLRLDDPTSDLLPWFDIGETYSDAPAVTPRGILTHSSGLPRESDYPYWSDPFDFPTHEQIVSRITEQSMLYPSDRMFQYSNLGMTLLGETISELSGQTYDEYIRRNILTPLDMHDTSTEIPAELAGVRLAQGYSATRRSGRRDEVKLFQARGIAPAAGFASTVEDLAKFASWQFRLLEEGGNEILNANPLREMQRVHWVDPDWNTTWGLGFSVSRSDDKTFVGHGGSCPGYGSHFRLQTKEKIATIFMSNALGVRTGMHTQRAYEIMAPAIKAAIDDPDDGKATDESLLKFVGEYDGFPWGGETHVIPWDGGLATVSFPTDNPRDAVSRLKHIEGYVFRRIRSDESLGEEIVFELGADGDVLRMKRHSNYSERMRPRS